MSAWVYMLSSGTRATLYIGVTNDIARRVFEHKEKKAGSFTTRYAVDRLVWMEEHPSIIDAIAREKAMKQWRRAWKVALIESVNPEWEDLYERLNW